MGTVTSTEAVMSLLAAIRKQINSQILKTTFNPLPANVENMVRSE
jgi:hypothetical protein